MTRRDTAGPPMADDDYPYDEEAAPPMPDPEPGSGDEVPAPPAADRRPPADRPPASGSAPAPDAMSGPAREPGATETPGLLPRETASDYQQRWEQVQAGFIDEPRNSVAEADRLIAEVMGRLSEVFDRQRRSLESQWARGEPSTEDLRLALQRYRDFFRRLVQS